MKRSVRFAENCCSLASFDLLVNARLTATGAEFASSTYANLDIGLEQTKAGMAYGTARILLCREKGKTNQAK